MIPRRRKGARRAARVHKELVHVLEGVEAVCAAPAEDVDVELVGLGEQQVGLVGDEGEALEEADADAAVGDDLGQRQGRGLDVVPALDDLQVGRHGSQVLVRVLVGEVSEAERLSDLARREELLELEERTLLSARDASRELYPRSAPQTGRLIYLRGNIQRPVGDVDVPNDEDEESHDGSLES